MHRGIDEHDAAYALAVALGDVLARRDALWMGWNGEVAETPDPPATRRMRRTEIVGFGLTPEMHRGFYAGFANAVLWPLCHYRLGLVDYRRADYATYLATNAYIADLLKQRIAPGDTLWIHDFHLIPLAREPASIASETAGKAAFTSWSMSAL